MIIFPSIFGTNAGYDSLPYKVPSFDLVINGQLAIDDILSRERD